MSLKLFYLTTEIKPFANTSHLGQYSVDVPLALQTMGHDVRTMIPKYGFVSERKYILREVIRLKDIPIIFNSEKHIINIKSAFIPETRVQVYFMENNSLYKQLPDLIYKARNGRIFSDIDKRFSFFNKAALDTLQSLFWTPDIIICNDWQTSLIPTLLKEQFIKKDFYSGIKSVYVIHSINNYRKFAKSTYDILGIEPVVANQKQIDNHIEAMEHADLTILMNYESEKSMNQLKKHKNLLDTFESTNHIIIDVPKKTNREIWENIANTIESACRKL